MRLDGPWRRDPPLGLVASGKRRSSMPVVTTASRDARHFGRHRRVPLPSPGRVLRIGADVVLELPAKPVLLHPDRNRAGHPEGVSQPCIPASAYRSRAFPRFDRRVVPRNWPDGAVHRSNPQYLRKGLS